MPLIAAIMHKVISPHLMWPGGRMRTWHRLWSSPFARAPLRQVESFFAPDAPHPLLIEPLSLTPQRVPGSAIAKARTLARNLAQALTQLLVAPGLYGRSTIAVTGTADPAERAATTLGEAMLL